MEADNKGNFSNYVIPLSLLENHFAFAHREASQEGRVPPRKIKETSLPILVRSFIWFLWLPVFLSTSPILAGIATFGWQVVKWTKTDIWTPVPVAFAFRFLGLDLSSVYSPKNWYGLAKIERLFLELPLSLCLIMAGLIMVITFVNISESFSNYLSSKYRLRNIY
jgi:hypothetical protein